MLSSEGKGRREGEREGREERGKGGGKERREVKASHCLSSF